MFKEDDLKNAHNIVELTDTTVVTRKGTDQIIIVAKTRDHTLRVPAPTGLVTS